MIEPMSMGVVFSEIHLHNHPHACSPLLNASVSSLKSYFLPASSKNLHRLCAKIL